MPFFLQDPGDQCVGITGAAAESIINTASEVDAKTGENVPGLFSGYLNRLHDGLNGCSDKFPNDGIMQIASYALPALRNIIDSPNSRMIKESEMVSQSHLMGISSRTITWLSKRPGRNIREKILNSPHVLAEKKLFSADTPENNALAFLIKRLHDNIGDRMEQAAELESAQDGTIQDRLCELYALYRKFRSTELGSLSGKCPTQANNVLLGDKNYQKVWRSVRKYKVLMAAESPDAANCMELFTAAVVLCVMAELNRLYDVVLCDSFCTADEIASGKMPRFMVYSDDGEVRDLRISHRGRSIDVSVGVICYDNTGSIYMTGSIKRYYRFEFLPDSAECSGERGIPFLLVCDDMALLRTFADLAAVSEITDAIIGRIREFVVLSSGEGEDVEKRVQDVCIDFTTYGVKSSNYNCAHLSYMYGDDPVIPNDKCLYAADKAKPVTLTSLLQATEARDDTALLLEQFAQTIGDGMFTYIVPDNVDEFEQKTLRRQIGARIGREHAYPVWRSVAAAEGVKTKLKSTRNRANEYMVIDTGVEGLPITRLQVTKYCFERYVPFEHSGVGDLSADRMAEDYLRLFVEKYSVPELSDEVIQRILHSGIVHGFLMSHDQDDQDDQNDARILISADQEIRFLNLFYDGELVDKVAERYMAVVADVLEDKRVAGRKCVVICDVLVLAEQISQFPGVTVAGSSDILAGAEMLCERWKRGQDTWKEHLPELRFMLPAGGRYSLLTLIDNQSVDAAVAEYRIVVKEPMVLPAGKKDYVFPLIKNDVGRTSRFVGRISNPSFPLSDDMVVHMEIIYRYGTEDTYELILRPDDRNAPFREIYAVWENMTYTYKDDAEIAVPEMKIREDICEQCRKSMSYVQTFLWKLERNIQQFDPLKLKKSMMLLYHNVRDMIIFAKKNDTDEICDVVGEFLSNLSDKYMDLIDKSEVPEKLNDVIADIRQFAECTLALVASQYKPNFDERFARFDFDSIKGDNKRCAFVFQNYLIFETTEEIWNHYINFFKSIGPGEKFSLMRSMSVMFWTNPDTLTFTYDRYPEVIAEFLQLICGKVNVMRFDPTHEKSGVIFANYSELLEMRDTLEMLLAILRLRTLRKGEFNDLHTGSEEAVCLAEQIKLIDGKMADCGMVNFKNSEPKSLLQEFKSRSRVKLQVSPPPALKYMSGLCYALTVYLTGELGADSIRILDYNAEN